MKWEDFRRSDNIDDRRSENACSPRAILRTIGQTFSDVMAVKGAKADYLNKAGDAIGGVELGIVNAVSDCIEEKRATPTRLDTKLPTPSGF